MKGVLQTEVPERAPPRPQVPFGRNQGCEVSLWSLFRPSAPRSPLLAVGWWVSSRPPWPHFLPRGTARVCVWGGGHHVETEQGSHAQLSI